MSTDATVFVACCALALLALGIEIGQQHQAAVCPIVPGQQVVTTIDSRDGQMCVYAKAYGRALRRVAL